MAKAQQLTSEYGKGWGDRHLRHCIRSAQVFPDEAVVNTLCSQFSWSHLRLLMTIRDPVKRQFYIEFGRLERWRVRQVRERIQSLPFGRTAISRKPEGTASTAAPARKPGHVSEPRRFPSPLSCDLLRRYTPRDDDPSTRP